MLILLKENVTITYFELKLIGNENVTLAYFELKLNMK